MVQLIWFSSLDWTGSSPGNSKWRCESLQWLKASVRHRDRLPPAVLDRLDDVFQTVGFFFLTFIIYTTFCKISQLFSFHVLWNISTTVWKSVHRPRRCCDLEHSETPAERRSLAILAELRHASKSIVRYYSISLSDTDTIVNYKKCNITPSKKPAVDLYFNSSILFNSSLSSVAKVHVAARFSFLSGKPSASDPPVAHTFNVQQSADIACWQRFTKETRGTI